MIACLNNSRASQPCNIIERFQDHAEDFADIKAQYLRDSETVSDQNSGKELGLPGKVHTMGGRPDAQRRADLQANTNCDSEEYCCLCLASKQPTKLEIPFPSSRVKKNGPQQSHRHIYIHTHIYVKDFRTDSSMTFVYFLHH